MIIKVLAVFVGSLLVRYFSPGPVFAALGFAFLGYLVFDWGFQRLRNRDDL